jgi:hypothetical protein
VLNRPPCGCRHASVERRLRRAAAWRRRLDTALIGLGWQRNKWVSEVPYLAGNLATDLVEVLRTGRPVPHLGQSHLAVLDSPDRLSQDPGYRGYWYNADTHTLVGMHLVLDLNQYQGKYHIIEVNVDPALRPARRQLYDFDLDPLLSELAGFARTHDFRRVVLLRRSWSEVQTIELTRATHHTGIEFVGAGVAALTRGYPPGIQPMLALPGNLLPRTMYVIGTSASKAPLYYFIHNKLCSARWIDEAIRQSDEPSAPLACIPAFDRLVVPPLPSDRRWPNLVVKLANADYAQAIVMGRFETVREARSGLKLDERSDSVPGLFRIELLQRIWHKLFRVDHLVLYQPFVPPEVIDGRARHIRLHVFVSPLASTYLSADGVIAGEDLPANLPSGLVTNPRAYVVSFSRGGTYCRLPGETEAELREIALEFGRLAKSAIEKKFFTADERQ